MNVNSNSFTELVARPFVGRVIWVLFAIVFFYSGLYFTEFVMAPRSFAGGWLWLWVAAFPFLLPAFFIVNRRFGCASGACREGACAVPTPGEQDGRGPRGRKSDRISVPRMPGA